MSKIHTFKFLLFKINTLLFNSLQVLLYKPKISAT